MNRISFSWEGSEDPDDLSGIAMFGCGRHFVRTVMPEFAAATNLLDLLELVYKTGKRDTIDNIMLGISRLLDEEYGPSCDMHVR